MVRIGNSRTISDIEFVIDLSSRGVELGSWHVHGVDCTRDRLRFNGQSYAFTIDVLQLKFAGTKRTSWHAVIVSEQWRFGPGDRDARTTKWLKAISGKPSDVIAWMRRYRTLKTEKPIGSPATGS